MLAPLFRLFRLERPELRAWAMYDWANSAFVTTVIAAVFPIYFASVVARDLPGSEATARFALASSVALAAVALLSPLLGALADRAGILKPLLGAFLALGVLASAGLFFVGRGDVTWALVLFGLGNVGVTGSQVFYDALLRHLAQDEELDRTSSAGYALGYLGGGLLLVLQLVLIQHPRAFGLADAAQATRVSFLTVAAWWLVFSLPLLVRVPEPRGVRVDGAGRVRGTLRQLGDTFRHLRDHPDALLLLAAYLLYSDGIGTIIRMATLYGAEVGIAQGQLIQALLVTQVVGVPASVLLGKLADVVGAKRTLLLTLAVYTGVSVVGYFLRTAWHFYALALLVGLVQGGSQALSRSLFAQMVPRHRTTQFFSFFSVFEKVTAILGPAVFAATVRLSGSSRTAVLSVILFFAAGAAVLARVDPARGRARAREAEADAARGSVRA